MVLPFDTNKDTPKLTAELVELGLVANSFQARLLALVLTSFLRQAKQRSTV